MDRRSLLDDDTPAGSSAREMENVFDDDNEVEDFEGMVADGYRPGQSHDREGGLDEDDDEDIRTVAAHYATGSISAGPSRNSTVKTRRNPFEDENEDDPPLRRTPSGNFSAVRRSTESSSSDLYAAGSTSRFGAAGPSHPYAMYPQGTVARTPSVATQSTTRPSRRQMSQYAPGPQHPYSLYPQGVGDDVDDDHDANAHNPVPVGFLGLGQSSFQRRRGPDGEEQDILGDFGHAEQLPPYTRYPEDGPEKVPLLDVPAAPTALHSRAPVLGTDPGMSLMHEPLLPVQQQSMTDESTLQRQNSRLSRLSQNVGLLDGDSSQRSLLSKKSWTEKSWRERRRTRFCGIPCLWLLIIVGAIVFIGAIVGGAVGGFAAGQDAGQQQAYKAEASSTLYDASLITTATGVPPATGTYPLSLGMPEETQAACLKDPGDQAAWSCSIVGSDQIWIAIAESPAPNDGNTTGGYLFTKPSEDPSGQLSYGSQVSNMNTAFAPFLYVTDLDAPQDGHAFYFQQTYNKLVVVEGNAIDTTTRKFKRNSYGSLAPWLAQKQYATPGDKPWFCYWNATLMEVFIYKNEAAVPAPTDITTSSPSKITPPPTTTTPKTSPTTATTAAPWIISWASQWETVTTTISMPTTSATYSGVVSNFPAWMSQNYPDYAPSGSIPQKRQIDYENDKDSDDATAFKYLVKIEERRQPQSPHPMCVQYQVLYNQEWNVVTNDQGEQITITLDETDPPGSAYPSSSGLVPRGLMKKALVQGSCHCQWMSGQG